MCGVTRLLVAESAKRFDSTSFAIAQILRIVAMVGQDLMKVFHEFVAVFGHRKNIRPVFASALQDARGDYVGLHANFVHSDQSLRARH